MYIWTLKSLYPTVNSNEASDKEVKKAIQKIKKNNKTSFKIEAELLKVTYSVPKSKNKFVSFMESGIKSTSQSNRVGHALMLYENKKLIPKILTHTEVSQWDLLWWK